MPGHVQHLLHLSSIHEVILQTTYSTFCNQNCITPRTCRHLQRQNRTSANTNQQELSPAIYYVGLAPSVCETCKSLGTHLATEQDDTAWGQVLGPQVEVRPVEAARKGGAHVQLTRGHQPHSILHVLQEATASVAGHNMLLSTISPTM